MKVIKGYFGNNPKPYYFKTEIENLSNFELVVVDTKVKKGILRFVEYVDPDKFEPGHPSKHVLRRATRIDLLTID